ncbi:hypothetical protein EDB86DRAFT_1532851 [Lactarius hatsudake]|nr:hypothetical protein EDB86DRAFT_1532851 [Lactarius hatsudake]
MRVQYRAGGHDWQPECVREGHPRGHQFDCQYVNGGILWLHAVRFERTHLTLTAHHHSTARRLLHEAARSQSPRSSLGSSRRLEGPRTLVWFEIHRDPLTPRGSDLGKWRSICPGMSLRTTSMIESARTPSSLEMGPNRRLVLTRPTSPSWKPRAPMTCCVAMEPKRITSPPILGLPPALTQMSSTDPDRVNPRWPVSFMAASGTVTDNDRRLLVEPEMGSRPSFCSARWTTEWRTEALRCAFRKTGQSK